MPLRLEGAAGRRRVHLYPGTRQGQERERGRKREKRGGVKREESTRERQARDGADGRDWSSGKGTEADTTQEGFAGSRASQALFCVSLSFPHILTLFSVCVAFSRVLSKLGTAIAQHVELEEVKRGGETAPPHASAWGEEGGGRAHAEKQARTQSQQQKRGSQGDVQGWGLGKFEVDEGGKALESPRGMKALASNHLEGVGGVGELREVVGGGGE